MLNTAFCLVVGQAVQQSSVVAQRQSFAVDDLVAGRISDDAFQNQTTTSAVQVRIS